MAKGYQFCRGEQKGGDLRRIFRYVFDSFDDI